MEKKSANYWTKEKCQEEALKYETRGDFNKKSSYVSKISGHNDWKNDICSHMKEKKKYPGYWTKEKCREEALRYMVFNDFRKENHSAYSASYKKGWLDEITQHMVKQKSAGYWTYEKCKEEALLYNKKTDFKEKSNSCITYIYKNGWLELIQHMNYSNNDSKRCIYVFEFSDNHAYIGLTNDFNRRKNEHNNNGSVFKYMKINETYKLIQLTDYLDVKIAQEKEEFYVNEYKENGWEILNIVKTGSIGATTIIWTEEKCKSEALKYNSRLEMKLKNSYLYETSRKNNWLDKICSHMSGRKPNGYWTKEKCQTEALKYNTRIELINNNRTVYDTIRKNDWLVEMCSHMEMKRTTKK